MYWRRKWQPTPVFLPRESQRRGAWWAAVLWGRTESDTTEVTWQLSMDFPGGSDSKESACNVGDVGSIPGLGRSPGGGHGNPLQYPCLENPHGQRSLAAWGPWGCKELGRTKRLSTPQHMVLKQVMNACQPWLQLLRTLSSEKHNHNGECQWTRDPL